MSTTAPRKFLRLLRVVWARCKGPRRPAALETAGKRIWRIPVQAQMNYKAAYLREDVLHERSKTGKTNLGGSPRLVFGTPLPSLLTSRKRSLDPASFDFSSGRSTHPNTSPSNRQWRMMPAHKENAWRKRAKNLRKGESEYPVKRTAWAKRVETFSDACRVQSSRG